MTPDVWRPALTALLVVAAVAHVAMPVAAGDRQQAPTEPPTGQKLDEILAGFADTDEETAVEAGPQAPTRRLRLGGDLRLGTSYNVAHQAPAAGATDWRGLSRLRLELGLEADVKLSDDWRLFASGHVRRDLVYGFNGRGGYTDQVLDRYEDEVELDDTFLAGSLGRRVHLTVGRQVVAWGTSETVRVTDILNPLDLREPGLTDIDDLRLPVAMTRLELVAGLWSLSGIAIHEMRFDRTPAFGHDFFPGQIPLPPASTPASSMANTEFAASARGSFRGWDLALYFADVCDDQPHLELSDVGLPELVHGRISMLGAAWDLAIGDTLLKAEAAHFRGIEYFYAAGDSFARTDLMAGLEFSGLSETFITFEVVRRRLHGFRPALAQPPDLAARDRLEWVVRASRTFLHQTLTLSLVTLTLGATGDDGALQRFEARYDLSDSLEITGGVVLYQSGDRSGFETIGDNDRLFLDLKYRF